ncbi:SapC family protein [Sphingomonas sp. XXL09]|uniref:SapC family protein n=1 Tax=Sphingomonas sp. XXL09 TaxID=3457787 RepID=UPI00406BCFAF
MTASTPQPLNNVDHAGLRVRLERGAGFGDAVNQVAVFATEFEDVAREYPIVFRARADGGYDAVALLGFARDQNLFLDDDRWDAHYIPALLQRGPFSIGVPADGGAPTIHIDPAHPRVSDAEGAPIFLPHGGQAPLLDRIGGVLRRIYAGTQIAPHLSAALLRHDLLEPVELQVETAGGASFRVPDCHVVAEARLATLDATALAALHHDDFLRPAIWAASSLGTLPWLAERAVRRGA